MTFASSGSRGTGAQHSLGLANNLKLTVQAEGMSLSKTGSKREEVLTYIIAA
jgi:hypothetical protein